MITPPKKQPIPFGKYLLLDRINIGGMAEVWRGKQFGASGFERLVAIKRILPNIAEDEEFITMFIDEAKISVKLNHANIAQIYELGQIQSSYFIAMEYIPGKDMRAIFERCRKRGEPAPIPLTCYVVGKLCEGLDYAHRKKDDQGRDMVIVHRDVSPQNVLMSYEGEVKVIDFGIAKAAGKATKTQAGILKGKFGYMSPEQIRGLPLDQRSDVFAIGVCLYEMLTGERLFVGESDFSVLEKVRKADVLPPSTYNRRIPETLEKIVLKALARDVDERYQYASELADDLQRFLITSDSIFSRKDLMQYMKSTFAEEVEREKVRIQEYAEIQPLPGMVEDGSSPMQRSVTQPLPTPRVPSASQVMPQSMVPATPGNAATREQPSPAAVRRTASLTSLPKLTAATAVPTPQDDNGATIISDSQEPLSPPASNLPKLTAAAAAPTNQDDNGATVLAAGPEEATGPIDTEPSTLHDDDRTAALGRLPRMTPSVDPRFSRPPPSPPRGVQAYGQSDTDPGMGLPGEQLPTPNLNRPPVLRPMGEPPTLDAAPPRAVAHERPAPPTLAPSRAPQPAEDDAPPRSRPYRPPYQPPEPHSEKRPPAPARSRTTMLAVLGAVAVAVLLAVLVVALRSPSKGLIIINVMPSEMRGKSHLFINGVARSLPAKWPAAFEAPIGPAVVMISVEGYEPFTRTVEVKESSAEVSSVQWDIPPKNASTPLVVVTEPSDAEVRIDGETVKKEGVSEPYLGETAVGSPRKIEVLHAGYRGKLETATAPGAGVPLKVKITLDRLDSQPIPVSIVSEPPGATVTANGKQLGLTPTTAKLPADVQSVTLSKKCYDSTEVPVQAPANAGNLPLELHGTLRKQQGCR